MFRELIERIATALNGECLPYMIIGGQAVLYYGEPRFTKDIDITLGVGVDFLGKVVALASRLEFQILVNDIENFVKKTMVLPAMEPSSGIRVDFIFSYSLYEKQAIDRAVEVKFNDSPVKIASLEDVVIHKIVAGRPRDIEDIKTILLKNPKYDRTYILYWLKQFDQSLGENLSGIFEELEKELK